MQQFTSKSTDIIFNNPEETISTLEKESKKYKIINIVFYSTLSLCLMTFAICTLNPLFCISSLITLCITAPMCKLMLSPNIPSGYRAQIIKQMQELDRNEKILQIVLRMDAKEVICTFNEEGEVKNITFPIDDFQKRTDIDNDTLYIGETFIAAVKWSGEKPE